MLDLLQCIITYLFSTVLYKRINIHSADYTPMYFWLFMGMVIFAYGNHKTIQTRDCHPILVFNWHIANIKILKPFIYVFTCWNILWDLSPFENVSDQQISGLFFVI